MKTLKLVAVAIAFLLAGAAQAQISFSAKIGTPPRWAPSGYTNVRWYYLPDLEIYYDVHSSDYIYFNGIRWVRNTNLPEHYRGYDLFHGRKVVLNRYHGNTPYRYHKMYNTRYGKDNHWYKGEKPGRGNEHRSDDKFHQGNRHDHDQNMNKKDKGRGNNKDKGKGKKE